MPDREIEIHYEEPLIQVDEYREDGVEVPLERVSPETLTNLISEFVTREWEELGDSPYTREEKIEQVRRQLQEGRAKLVFDFATNTGNIVPAREHG